MKTLQNMAAERLRAGHPLPDWLKEVRASCLRHDCDLHWRQREAGANQYAQSQVGKIPVHSTMKIFLQEKAEHPTCGVKDWVAEAILKSGQQRLETKVFPSARTWIV